MQTHRWPQTTPHTYSRALAPTGTGPGLSPDLAPHCTPHDYALRKPHVQSITRSYGFPDTASLVHPNRGSHIRAFARPDICPHPGPHQHPHTWPVEVPDSAALQHTHPNAHLRADGCSHARSDSDPHTGEEN